MSTTAIIAAAGSGTRLGYGIPKAFVPLNSVPILRYSASCLAQHPAIDRLVVTLPQGFDQEKAAQVLAGLPKISYVIGGSERHTSVYNALHHGGVHDGITLIHDAARPLLTPAIVDALILAAQDHPAIIPYIPVVDTIKILSPTGLVEKTVERSRVAIVQTPQVFHTALIKKAHEQHYQDHFTDDAAMVEALGEPVLAIPGSPLLRKITNPEDVVWAEGILASGQYQGVQL